MKKKIAIFGSFSGINKGDVSIVYSIIENLNKINDNLYFIINSKNPTRINKYLIFSNLTIYKAFTNYLGLNIFKTLKSSDVVVIGGGGLFFSKKIYNPFYNHIINISLLLIINKIFYKRPTFLYSVGSSHIKSKIAIKLTKFILANVDVITVRDEYTKEFFSKLTKKDIFLSRDPAFLLESEKNINIKKYIKKKLSKKMKNIIICINDVSFNIKTSKSKYNINKFLKFVNMLSKEYNVVLFQNDSKINLLKKIVYQFNYTNNISYIEIKDLHPKEIIYLISKFDLSISLPMHFSIYSYLAKIPLITILYDDKVKNFNKIIKLKNSYELNKYPTLKDINKIIFSNRTQIVEEQIIKLAVNNIERLNLFIKNVK